MNCLEKFKIKRYDNLQTTQPQENDKNFFKNMKNAMKLSVPKIQTKTSINQKNLNKSLKTRKSEKHIKLF